MSWQNSNTYRWMMYLHQHGGQLLDDDLKSLRINSPAGIETIAWTQRWFKEGLVRPSTSLKSSEQTQNLFANGTIGMLLNGNSCRASPAPADDIRALVDDLIAAHAGAMRPRRPGHRLSPPPLAARDPLVRHRRLQRKASRLA